MSDLQQNLQQEATQDYSLQELRDQLVSELADLLRSDELIDWVGFGRLMDEHRQKQRAKQLQGQEEVLDEVEKESKDLDLADILAEDLLSRTYSAKSLPLRYSRDLDIYTISYSRRSGDSDFRVYSEGEVVVGRLKSNIYPIMKAFLNQELYQKVSGGFGSCCLSDVIDLVYSEVDSEDKPKPYSYVFPLDNNVAIDALLSEVEAHSLSISKEQAQFLYEKYDLGNNNKAKSNVNNILCIYKASVDKNKEPDYFYYLKVDPITLKTYILRLNEPQLRNKLRLVASNNLFVNVPFRELIIKPLLFDEQKENIVKYGSMILDYNDKEYNYTDKNGEVRTFRGRLHIQYDPIYNNFSCSRVEWYKEKFNIGRESSVDGRTIIDGVVIE